MSQEAEQAFQASIALGDYLLQPQGNLSICVMMLERYDEAEAALKRTLLMTRNIPLRKTT